VGAEFPVSIEAGESKYLPVVVNPCVGDGVYTDTLLLNTNDGQFSVPVVLYVTDAGPIITPTPTVEPTITNTPTVTDTPENTPTATNTPEVTETPYPTPTDTPPVPTNDKPRLEEVIIEWADGITETYPVIDNFIFLPLVIQGE
jgi:hypothetical protein